MSDAMAAEFDTVAEWTAQVALDLGRDFHLPAACRGSGGPGALDWLIRALACHFGEVARNPYHLRLPAWFADSVRRGGELVLGAGSTPPDADFATLYQLQGFDGSRWGAEHTTHPIGIAVAPADGGDEEGQYGEGDGAEGHGPHCAG